jgi:hypothetical protein
MALLDIDHMQQRSGTGFKIGFVKIAAKLFYGVDAVLFRII